jgi:hypothetical protein
MSSPHPHRPQIIDLPGPVQLSTQHHQHVARPRPEHHAVHTHPLQHAPGKSVLAEQQLELEQAWVEHASVRRVKRADETQDIEWEGQHTQVRQT